MAEPNYSAKFGSAFNPKYGPGATFMVDPDTLHGQRAIENAALLCHAANGGYCAAIGEDQLPWDKVRESAISGVRALHFDPSITPEQLHEKWMAEKAADGWVLGEAKDVEKKKKKKTHPCMVPYAELPEFQRRKDVLFQATARGALYVYGMRFAQLADVAKKHEIAEEWKSHDSVFDVGMFVITGRIGIVADGALAALTISYGGRAAKHPRFRNQTLHNCITSAMASRDAADAYGYYSARKWPEEMPPFVGEKRCAFWHVLYGITHAVMEIEGVAVQTKISGGKWTYGDVSAIDVSVWSGAVP